MKKHLLLVTGVLSFYYFQAQTKEIKPISRTAIAPNSSKTTTKVTPATNNSSKLAVADSLKNFRPTSIPKRGFATDWLIPKNGELSKIPVFSKIELGIHFPDSLSEQINAFLNGEDHQTSLNPFDPEQVDVYAELEHQEGLHWIKVNKLFGFYYQDFNRETQSSNLESWNWEKIISEDYFRIRFTTSISGKWRITTFVKIKGKELTRMGAFEFTSTGSKNKGFLKAASDKRHFDLGSETFIPIGQNLAKPSCYIEKDSVGKIINDPFKCAACPCAGIEDWCAHLKNLPMHPKAYMTYHDELNNLKKSGANYFRMINFPFSYEIEYEQLGNYSNRMNCAWELDKLLEKAEKLDLKINFNLFVAYPLMKSPYGANLWDWYADNQDDKGYCYRSELGLKEPIEFLTNINAKKHFKNRIRYYIARYGYSTSIGILELMSEINNKFPNHPQEIYQWQKEMAEFIKNDLHHTNHLLAVNYDGSGPDESKGDLSFSLSSIDVMGHNIHRVGVYRSDLIKIVEAYQKHQKPIIFSEIGTGDSGIESCDKHSEWLKDLWFTLFTGTATTGINWNLQHDYNTWSNFRSLKQFLAQINLNDFTKFSSQIRKDKLVEILYMTDSSSKKAIGVLQNTTWNYYTQDGGKCKANNQPTSELTIFKNVRSLKGKKGLFITLHPHTEYKLEWYNPITAKNIDTTLTFTTGKRGKTIIQHPILNKDIPFIAFKIYTKESPFRKPINNSAIKTTEIPLKIKQPKPIEIQEK